ncbi:MAG: DUF2207 domain-containing protein [Chloroflexota bacterium]
MMHRVLAAFLMAALLVLPVSAQDEKSYSADRFDVDVTVQPGGSLAVTEQVDFRFEGGPFSYVFREIPTDHTDGIRILSAGADGASWPEGTGPGQVEIEGGDPIRITWHLPPTTNKVQSFNLSYEALGVVRQGEEADILDWQALPESYEYTIAGSTTTFTYPPTADLIGTPQLLESKGDIITNDNQVQITAGDLGPDEPLIMRLNFASGSLITTPPAWQAQQQAADDLAWVWIGLAGLIFIGGLGGLFLAARPYKRETKRPESVSYSPPSDLSPALAGIISGNDTSVSWNHALATVFDFAGRGYLEIEELGNRKWYQGEDFLVSLLSKPNDLLPHEQALFELLFHNKSGELQTSVTGNQIGDLVTSARWGTYEEVVKDELITADLLSPKREEAVMRFLVAGGLLLFLSAALLVGALLLMNQFGLWTFLVAGAFAALGIMAFLTGGSISIRTTAGEQVAQNWEPFRRYMDQASKGKERIANPELFERYLPYAMSFGVAEGWAKYNEKAGWHEAPGYFRALDMDDGATSIVPFIGVIVATSNSGGAAAAGAGAAAAGAAGGGASGAG